MPNRLLRESICTSDTIDKLSWFEEALYYRLIVNCDDFGRFDGRTAVIKNRLFPLKDNLTLKTVETALHGLANAGLVVFYMVEDKRFLCLPTWGKYQTQRAKYSKYPAPDDGAETSENICDQMQADVPVFDTRYSRNDIRYLRDDISAEPLAADAPPVISLPLNDGTFFDVSENDRAKWSQLYPNVDVLQQLRNMAGWCDANPTKRKTRGGIKRFITAWLAREQDKGGKSSQNKPFVYDYGNTEGSL